MLWFVARNTDSAQRTTTWIALFPEVRVALLLWTDHRHLLCIVSSNPVPFTHTLQHSHSPSKWKGIRWNTQMTFRSITHNECPRHRRALVFANTLLYERSLATKDCTVVIDSHNCQNRQENSNHFHSPFISCLNSETMQSSPADQYTLLSRIGNEQALS